MAKFNVDDLIEKGLVRVKQYDNGLRVLKYHKKIFWDNLWHLDERLLDCRGTVVDQDDNIVIYPFTKVFNFGENNTLVHRDTPVQGVRKVNGFMAACSMFRGKLLVSTTGTLDSDYEKLAENIIFNTCDVENLERMCMNHTAIFEITHCSDPHIVEEKEGVYLIGYRENTLASKLFLEYHLGFFAKSIGALRPDYLAYNNFQDLKDKLREVNHEGFMVRDSISGETLCKLKSPHYLSKKWLMRMSKKKVEQIFDGSEQLRQQLDEEYYPLLDYILETFDKEVWLAYNEQQRRTLIEEYLGA